MLTGLHCGAVFTASYRVLIHEHDEFFRGVLGLSMCAGAVAPAQAVDTTVSWDVPVVYGQGSSCQVELTVQAFGPNSTSDFSHRFTMTAVQALDAQGQAVAGRFLAGSGALLPAAPVPEQPTVLMLLVGLGVLGLVHRCRRN